MPLKTSARFAAGRTRIRKGTEMNGEFAGCGEHLSGQRFLDSSVPRLIRHFACCETADGDSNTPPAGKDQKLSQEYEDGVLIGREAPVPPLLDEVQIKRDTPTGRRRYCGAYTACGVSKTGIGKTRYCKVGCKCWDCSGCGPRRASMYRIRIGKTAERYRLNKLLTLTLDPKKLKGRDSTEYINEVFADFRVYLRRRVGHSPTYIRVLEYQENGNAHLHILLNCWLPQDWIKEAWSALGGGVVVDIRFVDMHRISHYLSKYLSKQMLMCAPKGARRVTTSRDIRLLEKLPSDFEWRILRIPVLSLFDFYRARVTGRPTTDGDGYLIAFETFAENRDSAECSSPSRSHTCSESGPVPGLTR